MKVDVIESSLNKTGSTSVDKVLTSLDDNLRGGFDGIGGGRCDLTV